MKHLVLILLVCVMVIPALFVMPATVSAATTVYANDFAGWQAAVGGVYITEDFNDTTLNSGLSVVSDLGYIDTTYGWWWDQLNYSGGPTTFTTWKFANPIRAFGGTWNLASFEHNIGGPGSNIEVLTLDGSWISIGVIDRESLDVFWGFVSDVPFTQVRLQAYNNEGWTERYVLDNMVYSISQGVQITLPSAGDSFWITNQTVSGAVVPVMPTINCQAKVVGITPDPTASTKFTWDYEIHYNPSDNSEYGPDEDISYKWPSSPAVVGSSFQLNFRNVIQGGDLTIKVTAIINENTYSDSKTVKILARNPSVSAITDLITNQVGINHTLWRIASVESDFTQFLNNGYPNWSHDKHWGVGIMQLTPYTDWGGAPVVWDWTKNAKGGIDKFKTCLSIANRWHNTIADFIGFKTLVNNYNQIRANNGLPPLTISVPKLTSGDFATDNIQQRERDTIRMYNGAAGKDIYYDNVYKPLHEYRIERDSNGVLVLDNINEHSLRADAKWVEVPVGERPQNVGDPDYVNHVLSEPIPGS